jgi:hypothetical protein
LGFDFDVRALHADLERAVAFSWARHPSARNYVGEWSDIALRSVDGVGGQSEWRPDLPAAAYRDTVVLAGCEYLRQVLAQFQCPVGSARLLQLTPGSVSRDHTHPDRGHDGGVLRLHVPIQTQPDVELFVEDERVPMRAGECWYIDASSRHRVVSPSSQSRVHLVFDCEPTDWLRERMSQAGFKPRRRAELEQRGVRRAELEQVILELRSRGGAVAERLAEQLERERAARPEPPSAAPRSRSGATASPAGAEPGWIPFDLVQQESHLLIEWRCIGEASFTDPWLEDTVRANGPARNGGLAPRLTPLEVLDEPLICDSLEPRGLIFHASRTGSTLITQMLSRSPRLCVLSEPPIVEALLQAGPAQSPEQRATLARRVKAALAHLARRKSDLQYGWVLKLESQHVLELPLFEQCYPGLPWIFLFRAPAEILRSQQRERGRQMVPGMISAERLGLEPSAIDPSRMDAYCALLIEQTFQAALTGLTTGRGRAVHYRELPEYAWRELDVCFGLDLQEAEVTAMRERCLDHAKHPGQRFGGKSRQRQHAESELVASEPLQAVPEALRQRLALLYERLRAEARRARPVPG